MNSENKTLNLTLTKNSFEIMITGEKNIEYRKVSEWILSRLNKNYNDVKFINGYGKKRPFFIAKFIKWDFAEKDEVISYSNGQKVYVDTGTIRIFLGNVIETGNL